MTGRPLKVGGVLERETVADGAMMVVLDDKEVE